MHAGLSWVLVCKQNWNSLTVLTAVINSGGGGYQPRSVSLRVERMAAPADVISWNLLGLFHGWWAVVPGSLLSWSPLALGSFLVRCWLTMIRMRHGGERGVEVMHDVLKAGAR